MRTLPFHSKKTSFANPKLFILILVLILLYGAAAFSQTNVYINPNANHSDEDGTMQKPYNSWSDFGIQDNHNYYQLRGTTETISNHIQMYRISNVKMGAYGPGNILPTIIFDNGSTGSELISIGASHNITIDSLELSGEPCFPDAIIKNAGDWQAGGWDMDGLTVTNCNIHHGHWNFFMIEGSTTYRNISILNCEVHHSWDDCFYFDHGDMVEVGYCNIHTPNQKYFDDPATAGGDGVQFHGTKTAHVHHCTIDRGDTGNKFCIIYNETGGYTNGWIIIENNILTTPISSGNGGAGIFLKQAPGAIVRYNEIKSNPAEGGVVGIYAENDTLLCYYNIFKELPAGVMSGNTDYTEVNNCVFYHNIGMDVDGNGGGYLGLRNNIFYHLPGKSTWSVRDNWVATFENDNNCYNYEYPEMLANINIGANSSIGDPEFLNAGTNFRLSPTSPCLNAGTDLSIPIDIVNTIVPQGTAPEVGCYESDEGSSSNSIPEIEDQDFQIDENLNNGQAVGTVVANDPDAGQTLTYSIANGNTGNAFLINSSTGEISIANSTQVNFESNPSFSLTVQVQDNGAGYLTNQATIEITLNDINESPDIPAASFSIDENSSDGVIVGTVSASDQDNGQTLSFSIVGGNSSGTFQIGSSSGEISVANNALLNFESNPSFPLTVEVEDDGAGNLSSQATITITLNDLNESPDISAASFSIDENLSDGTTIGTVSASDPDNGQTLSFSIVGGNSSGTFQIGTGTGEISIADNSLLDFESNPSFALTVQVEDNGTGSLSDQASITITLNDINDSPDISAASFSIDENSSDGVTVGTVSASDQDNGQTLSFSIVGGNSSGTFQIGSSSGEISVANNALLNFESNPSFPLTVEVEDDGAGNLSSQATITINLNDLNESPDISAASFSIDENLSDGVTVGTVSASDPDNGQTLSFSIVEGNSSGTFQIGTGTGEITIADNSLLDFESNPSFQLTVHVEDDGAGNLSDQATITINLNDLNESPDISAASFSIDENSSDGVTVGTVSASDQDNGQTLSFSIVGGNSSGTFQIESSSGEISVANNTLLNFESNPSFPLTVQVQDDGNGSLTNYATISINLIDLNETPNINNQSFSISDAITNGELVGSVLATDPDAGQSLSFVLLGGNTDDAFQINSTSGDIIVANSTAIDIEINPVFYLDVRVEDNGEGNLYDEAVVTISLSEANEVPSIDEQSFSVIENSESGEQIGLVIASDPDQGQTLTYSIIGGNTNSAFSIGSSSGALSVMNSSVVNFEIYPEFSLLVQVQDNGPGNLTSQANITVNVQDINEAPAIANQGFSIDENCENGQSVGTVYASDEDNGQVLSFTIISGNTDNAFQMSLAGEISVSNAAAMDHEINASFSLVVEVEDNGTGNLTDLAIVTIYINDLNESPSMANQEFNETIDIGLVLNSDELYNIISLGTILATDLDIGQEHTYSITSGDDTEIFDIEASTGELLIIDPYQLSPGWNKLRFVAEVIDDSPEQYSASANITVIINLTDEVGNYYGDQEYMDVAYLETSEINCILYPNPTSETLNIEVNMITDEKLTIGIYSTSGSCMFEKEYYGNSSHLLNDVDVSDFSQGVYIVDIRSGDMRTFKKFVKK